MKSSPKNCLNRGSESIESPETCGSRTTLDEEILTTDARTRLATGAKPSSKDAFWLPDGDGTEGLPPV
jgi:hypothetical protein